MKTLPSLPIAIYFLEEKLEPIENPISCLKYGNNFLKISTMTLLSYIGVILTLAQTRLHG